MYEDGTKTGGRRQAESSGERYMKNMVEQAHDQGKLLRIWGAPNNERNWRTMLRSNVDYLSIDDHAKFATFASRVHRI